MQTNTGKHCASSSSPQIASAPPSPPALLNRESEFQAAAAHVLAAHYSKPYPPVPAGACAAAHADHGSAHGVPRPNHGLANAVRKAHLVRLVAAEYAQHYLSPGSSQLAPASFEFTPNELVVMEVAMLFEVVGRETEAGFKDDSAAYGAYKQASCEAFAEYASQRALPSEIAVLCRDALDHMYCDSSFGAPYGRMCAVFEVCHELDLLRCCGESAMQSKLERVSADAGDEARQALTRFAEGAILATGDRLFYSPSGGSGSDHVAERWAMASLNSEVCIALVRKSEQVPVNEAKFLYTPTTLRLGSVDDHTLGLSTLLGVGTSALGTLQGLGVEGIRREVFTSGSASDRKNFEDIVSGAWADKKTVAGLLEHVSARRAKLEAAHVVALRLYTTNSFAAINDPLRKDPIVRPIPFAVTTFWIADGLKKLRTCCNPSPVTLWRGMKDVALPHAFESGKVTGVEFACMSTTSSRDVAVGFAKSTYSMVFKIVTSGKESRGADIAFLSVYEHEKEYLQAIFPFSIYYLHPLVSSTH